MLAYRNEAVKDIKNPVLSLILTRDSFFYGLKTNGKTSLLIEADSLDLSASEPFSMEKEILNFLNNRGIVQRKFNEVHVSLMDPRFTLIHESLYSSGHDNIYIRNVLSDKKQHRIKARYISGAHHWCIYTIAGFLVNNILSSFPSATFSHAAMDLLTPLFNRKNPNCIGIYLIGAHALIAAIKEGALQFVNYYSVSSNEDILYHVLSAYKSGNLNADADELYFSGECIPSDSLYQLLYEYIRYPEPLVKGENIPVQQKLFLK